MPLFYILGLLALVQVTLAMLDHYLAYEDNVPAWVAFAVQDICWGVLVAAALLARHIWGN